MDKEITDILNDVMDSVGIPRDDKEFRRRAGMMILGHVLDNHKYDDIFERATVLLRQAAPHLFNPPELPAVDATVYIPLDVPQVSVPPLALESQPPVLPAPEEPVVEASPWPADHPVIQPPAEDPSPAMGEVDIVVPSADESPEARPKGENNDQPPSSDAGSTTT